MGLGRLVEMSAGPGPGSMALKKSLGSSAGSFTRIRAFRPCRQRRRGCDDIDRGRRQVSCKQGGGSPRAGKAQKIMVRSDGTAHLGSALAHRRNKPFPGPPPGKGPPLRVLPIGGLGEIGMNCMLVGVGDRYILVDAGLMFPDFTDLGMQKILPDTSFLAQWRDRIEAVFITHGHEDHIGALPWVLPALDPDTPIYAGGFALQIIKRRMQEFNMWDENRFKSFKIGDRFQLGPFECQPIRVTHSIPDCCGMILRSEHGNIVHTGDWKIDESPVSGELFDRSMFESIGREGVALFMSDSTNVLSPGRTLSEAVVERSIMEKVLGHAGKGRVITTQFASNLDRLASVKKAADAAGRKMAFIGLSLTTYLEAAHKEGRAPFDPRDLVPAADIEGWDPNKLLIVTTGSQAEPRAALSLASREASSLLRVNKTDLLLYSAKVIPGNDTRVMQMMNDLAGLGANICMGRGENLHTSGHAYRGELEEVLKMVQPRHFLPVHGEFAFLCAHAELARECGMPSTHVIRNGQMLGVSDMRNKNVVSQSGLLGQANLNLFYNDGNKGTGTADEMALEERNQLAVEGIVIAAIDVARGVPRPVPGARPASGDAGDGEDGDDEDEGANGAKPAGVAALNGNVAPGIAQVIPRLRARIRVTTRGMWVDQGRLLEELHRTSEAAVARLPGDATLAAVERIVTEAIRRECRAFNNKKPEVVVIVHEMNARAGAAVRVLSEGQKRAGRVMTSVARGRGAKGGERTPSPAGKAGPGLARAAPKAIIKARQDANPRERPEAAAAAGDVDLSYG